ncbi:DUF6520 family protein [Chryseobacterium sp. MDT2-18]|uniref:DUF6520 family protein n=1 Tax=Chryseobacterium sp. MDT2-18 TaxID=1259136 RepID=UPI002787E2F6|nr:DUF6520 family protein [Chryseobacterium sp. MDT2-18]MDQ0477462.1 hypothetical protein [Chryseobacterium sp. MDT2-18]
MKNLKTFLLPAFVVLAGAGSAYATHINKDTSKITRQGHVFRPNAQTKCVPTGKQCDTQGTVICTADVGMGPETLYDLNGSICPTALKERIVK